MSFQLVYLPPGITPLPSPHAQNASPIDLYPGDPIPTCPLQGVTRHVPPLARKSDSRSGMYDLAARFPHQISIPTTDNSQAGIRHLNKIWQDRRLAPPYITLTIDHSVTDLPAQWLEAHASDAALDSSGGQRATINAMVMASASEKLYAEGNHAAYEDSAAVGFRSGLVARANAYLAKPGWFRHLPGDTFASADVLAPIPGGEETEADRWGLVDWADMPRRAGSRVSDYAAYATVPEPETRRRGDMTGRLGRSRRCVMACEFKPDISGHESIHEVSSQTSGTTLIIKPVQDGQTGDIVNVQVLSSRQPQLSTGASKLVVQSWLQLAERPCGGYHLTLCPSLAMFMVKDPVDPLAYRISGPIAREAGRADPLQPPFPSSPQTTMCTALVALPLMAQEEWRDREARVLSRLPDMGDRQGGRPGGDQAWGPAVGGAGGFGGAGVGFGQPAQGGLGGQAGQGAGGGRAFQNQGGQEHGAEDDGESDDRDCDRDDSSDNNCPLDPLVEFTLIDAAKLLVLSNAQAEARSTVDVPASGVHCGFHIPHGSTLRIADNRSFSASSSSSSSTTKLCVGKLVGEGRRFRVYEARLFPAASYPSPLSHPEGTVHGGKAMADSPPLLALSAPPPGRRPAAIDETMTMMMTSTLTMEVEDDNDNDNDNDSDDNNDNDNDNDNNNINDNDIDHDHNGDRSMSSMSDTRTGTFGSRAAPCSTPPTTPHAAPIDVVVKVLRREPAPGSQDDVDVDVDDNSDSFAQWRAKAFAAAINEARLYTGPLRDLQGKAIPIHYGTWVGSRHDDADAAAGEEQEGRDLITILGRLRVPAWYRPPRPPQWATWYASLSPDARRKAQWDRAPLSMVDDGVKLEILRLFDMLHGKGVVHGDPTARHVLQTRPGDAAIDGDGDGDGDGKRGRLQLLLRLLDLDEAAVDVTEGKRAIATEREVLVNMMGLSGDVFERMRQ